MSISISYSKHSGSELKITTYEHIIRNEENAKRVATHTKSNHDPALAEFNVMLVDEGLDETKKKLIAYQQARRDTKGLSPMRKDAKAFVDATIQLSDDTLLAFGWKNDSEGHKLAANEQSSKAIKNVTLAYQTILKAVQSDEVTFGHVALADIHFDESNNPHLDCLISVLNGENPRFSVNEFLNGKNHYEKSITNGKKKTKKILPPKGKELSHKQTRLGELVAQRFRADDIEKFGLKRGTGDKSRAKARNMRREAEIKLIEARKLANKAYADKQSSTEAYNAEWGEYKVKMRALRQRQDKLFSDEERRKWDEAARNLKNAKSWEYVAQKTDGFIGIAFSIIAAIQQYKAQEQIDRMNQECQKALAKVKEQRLALKIELQKAKQQLDTATKEAKKIATQRDKAQEEFNALKLRLDTAQATISNSDRLSAALASREFVVKKREAKQNRAQTAWSELLNQVNNGILAEREQARYEAEHIAHKYANNSAINLDSLTFDIQKSNKQLAR